MERFLKHLARHLLTSFEDEISKLWIIFPNRRSGLYFKHYLSEYTRKAIWTPCCLTIDELMQRLSHLQVADHLFLNIELFETFKKITRSTEEFDEFFPWGEILLTDFNDIDKYLVDAGRLFSNLMAVKEIDSKFEDIDPVHEMFRVLPFHIDVADHLAQGEFYPASRHVSGLDAGIDQAAQ